MKSRSPSSTKYELLLVGEVVKIAFSAYMISGILPKGDTLSFRLQYLTTRSGKMFALALIYGLMNILSYVSLRNIGAGVFTIFAQCKILTTASFSAIILRRQYSWAQWRALIALMLGVLLFSEPIWSDPENLKPQKDGANVVLGTLAVIIEVTLSGFASIYFEKVIKTESEQLGIWERNFQLALGSFPIYLVFILYDGGGTVDVDHARSRGWPFGGPFHQVWRFDSQDARHYWGDCLVFSTGSFLVGRTLDTSHDYCWRASDYCYM
jgi:UDP-sugar transporter A1/2/3